VGWAPRDRVIAEITADPARSDRAIASAAGCDRGRVARVRAKLEHQGAIPRVEPADRAERPRPRQPRRARDRAVRVLVANPFRSDSLLASAARVGVTTICETRRELEQSGQIPRVPVSSREVLHVRRKPSRAHTAIVLGARTSREVADRAHVTMGWAWAALRAERARPPLPKPPLPPVACAHCGTMFVPTRRQHTSRPQRYCSDICADAAYSARRIARRPPPQPKPPRIIELPNAPSWEKGLCTHVPASQAIWWTSDNAALRSGAAEICRACPIITPCLEWSVNLPDADDTVYAGLGREGRRELRRLIRDQQR
jgi:Transcription factor WhiB